MINLIISNQTSQRDRPLYSPIPEKKEVKFSIKYLKILQNYINHKNPHPATKYKETSKHEYRYNTHKQSSKRMGNPTEEKGGV